MARGLAINVAANSTLPGRRAPIYPDGSFVYVPIPERAPTAGPVPTYADLGLAEYVPDDAVDRRVHHDPTFAGVHGADRYTYGDEHGVKAGPIGDLERGDFLWFYATLETVEGADGSRQGTEPGDTIERPPTWGAYLIGHFRLAADPVSGEELAGLAPEERQRYAGNAHRKRETPDARVLVAGDPDDSALYDRAISLSAPTGGAEANEIVTDLAGDSGRGPWWRRVLRFDEAATAALCERVQG